MLRSSLCDYSAAYIAVKGTIYLSAAAAAANENNKPQKHVAFRNNAPFRSCISKICNTFTGNAEGLHVVMYNLLEYGGNYSITSGSL